MVFSFRASDLSLFHLFLDVSAKVGELEGGRAEIINNHLFFSICLPALTPLPFYKISLLCSGVDLRLDCWHLIKPTSLPGSHRSEALWAVKRQPAVFHICLCEGVIAIPLLQSQESWGYIHEGPSHQVVLAFIFSFLILQKLIIWCDMGIDF